MSEPISAWIDGDEHEAGFGAQCKCGTYIHSGRDGIGECDGCGRRYTFDATAYEISGPTHTPEQQTQAPVKALGAPIT